MPRSSMVSFASGVIPLEKPLSKTHLPISTWTYSSGTLLALKVPSTASIISGPIPSPFATAIFIWRKITPFLCLISLTLGKFGYDGKQDFGRNGSERGDVLPARLFQSHLRRIHVCL